MQRLVSNDTFNQEIDMKNKVQASLVDRIVEKIEELGPTGWLMPFTAASGRYHNVVSKANYRGMNIFLCALLGDGDSQFASYKQWQELCFGESGKDVPNPLKDTAKGKGVPITFYKKMEKKDRDTGEITGNWPMLRYSTVFGASQVAELPAKLQAQDDDTDTPYLEKVPAIVKYVEATGATINYEGSRACFIPSKDAIEMPAINLWKDIEAYYPVLFHELTHWAGHSSRLNRIKGKRFGDRDYAFEELVAELGSMFQCNAHGLSGEPRDDHARYCAGWLSALKGGDIKYIFDAAKLAQDSVDYLDAFSNEQERVA